jgi:Xaa-Pro dipeptidase
MQPAHSLGDDPMDAASRRRHSQARVDTVRALVAGAGANAAMLSSRANVAWATAGGMHHIVTSTETGAGALLIAERGAWFLAPNIERARLAAEEFAGLGIEVIDYEWWDEHGRQACVGRLLGTGAGTAQPLDDAALEPGLVAHRSRLAPFDQERLARLGGIAAGAVEDALAAVDVGATEDELAASLLGRLVGVRAPVVLVAADGRIAQYRHPLPTSRRIEQRVMLVLVAEAWGLHVALTRFRWWADEPPELATRWDAVRAVQRAMTDASVPGATLGDVFAVAQAAYAAHGHPDAWREHHQGGTIAYRGRERVAVPGDPTPIEAGMALAWNPSIAGVKVEDTIIVQADGSSRVVTSRPVRRAHAAPESVVDVEDAVPGE